MNGEKPQNVCFLLPNFAIGGAETVVVNLANEAAAEGISTTLVTFNDKGGLKGRLNANVEHINLAASGFVSALFKLIRFLKQNPKKFIISALLKPNFAACIAKLFVKSPPVIVVTEHSLTSSYLKGKKQPLRLFCR